MDRAERALDQAQGGTRPMWGTPDPDGPGDAAYQRMQALLAKVQSEEAARARRN